MKLNLRNIQNVFHHKSSNASFRATMCRKRFSFVCIAVKLDDASTTENRWDQDRLACIGNIFEEFNLNCAQVRVPSPYLEIVPISLAHKIEVVQPKTILRVPGSCTKVF